MSRVYRAEYLADPNSEAPYAGTFLTVYADSDQAAHELAVINAPKNYTLYTVYETGDSMAARQGESELLKQPAIAELTRLGFRWRLASRPNQDLLPFTASADISSHQRANAYGVTPEDALQNLLIEIRNLHTNEH